MEVELIDTLSLFPPRMSCRRVHVRLVSRFSVRVDLRGTALARRVWPLWKPHTALNLVMNWVGVEVNQGILTYHGIKCQGMLV